jgi:hypothetical protein
MLAVSLSALYASPALARPGHHHKRKGAPEGAQKAPLYGPLTSLACGGASPTPATFRFVVLDTPGNEMTVSAEVALKRAHPNESYFVSIWQAPASGPGTCQSLGGVGPFSTNSQGNGNFHITQPRLPGSTSFFVQVVSATSEDLASPAVELD